MKATRSLIAQDTLKIFEVGHYLSNQETVNLTDKTSMAIQQTILYRPTDFTESFVEESIRLASESNKEPTTISFLNVTTLQAARQFVSNSRTSVGVLNFASAKNPGGGFLKGANAQEESLARSSALYLCQTAPQVSDYYSQNKYDKDCLYTHHYIFSPDVPVIRDDKGDLLPKSIEVSFLTAPAPNAGVALKRIAQKSSMENAKKKILECLKERIRYSLTVFARHQQKDLVLGAFGCGVFHNNPNDVARTFKHLLEGEFKDCFQNVVFAVPGQDQNTRAFSIFSK